MSSEKKHNRKQFEDMPLPDMEAAWQDMKIKMKTENEDRKPAAFLFLKKIALVAILLLIGAYATWHVVKPAKEEHSSKLSLPQTPGKKSSGKIAGDSNGFGERKLINDNSSAKKNNTQNSTLISADAASQPSEAPHNNSNTTSSATGNTGIHNRNANNTTETSTTNVISSSKKQSRTFSGRKKLRITNGLLQNDETAADKIITATPGQTTESPADEASSLTRKHENLSLKDARSQTDKGMAGKFMNPTHNPPLVTANKKIQRFSFSAGIGLQKQLPLGNQSGFGKNYYGGNNTLPDDLPSVYLRLKKNKKWFADAEFQFGAAQLLPPLIYNRQTSLRDTGTIRLTTSLQLKKAYYHRLPLSFNYYLKPDFSVGTGFELSVFHGAISEKNVSRQDLVSGSKTENTEIVYQKSFNDSFLYKAQSRLLVQTSYQWKRFTFGLRYTWDLEPYITFTTPAGELRNMRSQSLQALVRFRLLQFRKQ